MKYNPAFIHPASININKKNYNQIYIIIIFIMIYLIIRKEGSVEKYNQGETNRAKRMLLKILTFSFQILKFEISNECAKQRKMTHDNACV